MDFLEIRKKAKERAEARAAQRGAPASPAAPDPVVTDEDVVAAALAARLQGLPPPPAPREPEPDARFTTWRPGAGDPPAVPPPDAPEAPEPEPCCDAADAGPRFAIVTPAPDPTPGDPLDEFFYRPDEAAPPVPQLAAAPAMVDAPAAPLAREEYLTFLLGAEEYAVAIERVREVIRAPPITEVPRAPAHILGVVTVRGEVVAVVDPRRRLGLPPAALREGEGKVVVVDGGDGTCGLLVDRVASVVRLLPGSVEPCPQGIAGPRAELLSGIGRAAERLFTVIDVGALLRPAPREDLAHARSVDARG
jgi:purine-binding chemotaxis protein CheW